jgi:hypothetical protein
MVTVEYQVPLAHRVVFLQAAHAPGRTRRHDRAFLWDVALDTVTADPPNDRPPADAPKPAAGNTGRAR